MALQVALLGRAQRLIEKHLHRAMHLHQQANFIRFATAHKKRSIGRFALASQPGHGIQTGGLCQQTQLFEFGIEVGQTEIYPDQNYRSAFVLRRSIRTHESPPLGQHPRTYGGR